MASQLIKPDRDQDFYIEWSSVVEAPTAWGAREAMTEHLMRPHMFAEPDRCLFEREQIEKRFSRADDAGTSAYELGCGWDDEGEIYMQRGTVPRHRLRELVDRLEAEQDVSDLLIPFED